MSDRLLLKKTLNYQDKNTTNKSDTLFKTERSVAMFHYNHRKDTRCLQIPSININTNSSIVKSTVRIKAN